VNTATLGLSNALPFLDGDLVLKRDGVMRVLRQGDTATIEPNVWHDWWNAGSRDARARGSHAAIDAACRASASHTCSKHFLPRAARPCLNAAHRMKRPPPKWDACDAH
jgi:uncharacterized cupin superfamily protein